MSVRFCLSVRSHISKTTCPNFSKRSVHATCSRGSVLLRDNAMLCTSVLWMSHVFTCLTE